MEAKLTPRICAQIRKGLRLSVKTLADVLAVCPKTVDAWERRERAWPGLAGEFMVALADSLRGLGPDAAWGPSWLSRRQRLLWILRAAASAGADSCMGPVLVPPISLETLQPQGPIRHGERLLLDRESPSAAFCLQVRLALGLQLKELAQLLNVHYNTLCSWEHQQPLHGLEIDCYEALDCAVRRHGRILTWPPHHVDRRQRLLHVFQLSSVTSTCAASDAVLDLPEVFLRVTPHQVLTSRRTA